MADFVAPEVEKGAASRVFSNRNVEPLYLEDLEPLTEDGIILHCETSWTAPKGLDGMRVLIAYESQGSWGCDSSGWFLLLKGDDLYEVHGSHCSCYGFEDQWTPEKTTVEYLLSQKFSFSCGGYDFAPEQNRQQVRAWLMANLMLVEPS